MLIVLIVVQTAVHRIFSIGHLLRETVEDGHDSIQGVVRAEDLVVKSWKPNASRM